MTTKRFTVTGMSCAACSASVERAVGRLKGVEKVSVSLLAKLMLVTYDETQLTPKAIRAAVSKAGFKAREEASSDADERATGDGLPPVKTRLIASVILLVPLMLLSMGHMIGLSLPESFSGVPQALCEMLLALAIAMLNRKFYLSGFKALYHLSPNMDTLVALGSSAAILYSIAATLLAAMALEVGDAARAASLCHTLYYESGAMILTLVTVGKLLEERSKNRTGDAIRRLRSLAPDQVTVERDGQELKIPTGALVIGDVMLLRPGEHLPADGVILSGSSAMDESALTGESLPRDVFPGDRVLSASTNLSGLLRVRAEQVGSETTLSRIISLVETAGAEKAPVARLADKVSGIFVPVVMLIAAMTLVIWMFVDGNFAGALSHAIAVLVISCPCALGLATPVAVTVAAGRLAENGILIKSAATLENLSKIDAVVWDKTGTLTSGKPAVTDVWAASGDEASLLSLAGALERGSAHPLAEAITAYAGAGELPLSDFTDLPGRGVKATVDGKAAIAGSRRLMEENGIDLSPADDFSSLVSAAGKSMTFFALDGHLVGAMALADAPREGAKEALSLLEAQGIESIMLTGDNQKSARAAADRLGIARVVAEVLPDGKADAVMALRTEGKRVVMAGDGINDSPALAAADIGVAIGSASDIALDAADAVLMKNDVRDLPRAIAFAGKTMTNIRQNLFWAFFYNVIGIPLAAGAFSHFGITLPPMFGAAAMSLSSLFVVSNAMRLLKTKL